MRQGKPYILFVPNEIKKDIDRCFKRNREIYYFIVFSLINSAVHDKEKTLNDFTPFNVSKIKKIINREPAYYIKNLKKYDIIKSDKKFIKGQKSYHYKLNPEYNIDCNTIKIEPGSKLHEGIYRNSRNKKKNLSKMPEYLHAMAKKFNDIDLNYEGAYKWIESQNEPEKRLIYSVAIEQFRDKRTRYFRRNKVNNRLDTNLTNLKKEIRTFLKNDFISIDLKNSQPFLLSIILNQLINSNNSQHYSTIMLEVMSLDLVKWFGNQKIKKIQNVVKNQKNEKLRHFEMLKQTQKGNFYETLLKEFKGLTREEVKKIMFAVLYSRNSYYKDFQRFTPYRKEKEIFASLYPLEYQIIEILKEKDHSRLAVFMQRLESFIFIDCIAKELVNKDIIPLTIHDSILVETRHKTQTLKIIKDIFQNKIGIIPSFHIEQLGQYYDEKITIKS